MDTYLTPYLNFAGRSRQAMTYYHEVFGGELSISTFGDFGVPGMPADGVMHSQLVTPQFTIMAADARPGENEPDPGVVALAIHGSDLVTFTAWHARLTADGTPGEPLVEAPWGDIYGDVIDSFGIRWMFNVSLG